MKKIKGVITILILIAGVNATADQVVANSYSEYVPVEGALAKQVYNKLIKFTDKQCDDESCTIEVDSISCIGIDGFRQCTVGVFEQGKYVLKILLFDAATRLYNSLQSINKAFCDNEYTDLCVNLISEVKCECSGGFFNQKFYCELKI